MGKKINPKIYRLHTVTEHQSKWFATSKKQFAQYLQQDVQIRKFLKTRLRDSGVSRIELRRSSQRLDIVIATSKPGVIIGKSGSGIEAIKKDLKKKFFGSTKIKMGIEIEEVKRPELDANLVMQGIINQLEKRIPFRRAMKRSIENVMSAGAKGIKVICAGRLNGVEIARTETLGAGSVPTHTLRADIDYCRGAARTIAGAIGVKVWIYRGQVFADTKPVVSSVPARKPSKGRSTANKATAQQPQKRTIVKTHKPSSNPTTE